MEFAARCAIRTHLVARSTLFVAVDWASSGSYSATCGEFIDRSIDEFLCLARA